MEELIEISASDEASQQQSGTDMLYTCNTLPDCVFQLLSSAGGASSLAPQALLDGYDKLLSVSPACNHIGLCGYSLRVGLVWFCSLLVLRVEPSSAHTSFSTLWAQLLEPQFPHL